MPEEPVTVSTDVIWSRLRPGRRLTGLGQVIADLVTL
jgi:hypothetical protein